MSAHPGPASSCTVTLFSPGSAGRGARLEARVTGHATVSPTGPSGAINRSGHHVH